MRAVLSDYFMGKTKVVMKNDSSRPEQPLLCTFIWCQFKGSPAAFWCLFQSFCQGSVAFRPFSKVSANLEHPIIICTKRLARDWQQPPLNACEKRICRILKFVLIFSIKGLVDPLEGHRNWKQTLWFWDSFEVSNSHKCKLGIHQSEPFEEI